MTRDPQKRPTAQEAFEQWLAIRACLDPAVAQWRLQKRDETVGEWVTLSAIAAARQDVHALMSFF